MRGKRQKAPAPGPAGVPPIPPALHTSARAVWEKLGRPRQLRVAGELVRSRQSELRREFTGLVSVGYGWRFRGGKHLEGELVVCFYVEKKWDKKPGRVPRQAGKLPEYLYTEINDFGVRQLCAVPTDVRGRNEGGNIIPHANQMVSATSPATGFTVNGVPCCRVRLANGGATYLLSCYHVLALADVTPNFPEMVQVYPLWHPGNAIAMLSGFFGGVEPDGSFFDAALASIIDSDSVARLVTEPLPDGPVIQSEAELAYRCRIHTGRGVQVLCDWLAVHHNVFVPAYGALRNVTLPTIIEIQPADYQNIAQPGDSGSPVFDDSGTIFQGMHIAGTDAGNALFIPAYDLLRASNYAIAGGDEMLELT